MPTHAELDAMITFAGCKPEIIVARVRSKIGEIAQEHGDDAQKKRIAEIFDEHVEDLQKV